jgi:hypothetical protein
MGNVQLSQRAGMRVRGGWSRASTQKSLELFARRQYSPGTNTFDLAFFGEQTLNFEGDIIDGFRRVRLRNGGNDREFGNVRDELSHTLFAQAGFPDTQQQTPVAVFLNGEYYGFSWLKTPRTEDHWQRRYGGLLAGFEHIGDGEGGENRYLPEHWQGNLRAVSDWAEIMELVRGEGGLTDDSRFNEFTSRVCIDNLVLYYALQLYINNEDWPWGNMEMWRYFPEVDEDLSELHPFLQDGKWRFIAQDLEFAWNIYGRQHARQNTIENVRTGNSSHMGGQSDILYELLKRGDMRQKFADTFTELMEGAFHPDNVNQVLLSLLTQSIREVHAALTAGLYEPWNPNWPTQGSMRGSQNMIRDFARERPAHMVRAIYESLGIEVTISYLD